MEGLGTSREELQIFKLASNAFGHNVLLIKENPGYLVTGSRDLVGQLSGIQENAISRTKLIPNGLNSADSFDANSNTRSISHNYIASSYSTHK